MSVNRASMIFHPAFYIIKGLYYIINLYSKYWLPLWAKHLMGWVRDSRYWEQILWHYKPNKYTRGLFRGIRIDQELKLCQSRNLLCYMRHQVKREEKKILLHQTTSLYIQFVCHPPIIPHAWMYLLNLFIWSYAPPAQLLSTQPRHIIQDHNTSGHLLIVPNNSATFPPHFHTLSGSPIVSAIW